MQKKIEKVFVDYGYGFPVKLLNVPMVKVRGHYTPVIDYNLLPKVVLNQLSKKEGRLTGSEVRFIRHFFAMNLQEFAKRFSVSHPAVIKWESRAHRPTGMNWATEKDMRLFMKLALSSNPQELRKLYEELQESPSGHEAISIDVKLFKLAA